MSMPILLGPPQEKTLAELRDAWARWQALRQVKGEHPEWASFTCVKCPQQWPNHRADYYDENGDQQEEWINTKRCKKCKSKENKFQRFNKWFDDLYFLALRKKMTFCFIAITSATPYRHAGEALEIIEEAIGEIKHIKKTFARILREDELWKPYNSGLLVGELKWRRPGEPVYKTGREEFFMTKCFMTGREIWGRTPMRISEKYEAHPHVHYVGLIPKKNVDNYNHTDKMPYDDLIASCKKKNLGCYIEKIPIWRAQRYLKQYLYKDEATDATGKKHRIRDKVGDMRGL
jgi:hypothetical protein